MDKIKLLSSSPTMQHKRAAELLRAAWEERRPPGEEYRFLEKLLMLSPLSSEDPEVVSDRFHFHAAQGKLILTEPDLLRVRNGDGIASEPFLPIAIFLYKLRSAFNVGSIFRTTEAFRLGTIYTSEAVTGPLHPKVRKTAMGTHDQVPFGGEARLQDLPRPYIAFETASPSTPISSFSFPKQCTLLFGNEEFGIPKSLLEQCDHIVEIPLCGGKNSLNVASAFAIAAHTIRSQHPPS